MIFSFISLAIALIALILYFGERSKFLNKTDELTASIQKEMEEKLDIQSRYNTLVNDIKKEEEFTKSKKVDEIQLLFTKVNMLDDKLTYFNTAFKNKLDEIISLLGSDESNFDNTDNKIENFIPKEEVKITNTQDDEEEIKDNNIIEETQTEIEEENNNENEEIESEENQEETEETDIKNTDVENIDYEENADGTITEDEEDDKEEDDEEVLDDEEQNQSNDNKITDDVLNDIKDTLEDGDVLEATNKEEELTNYTDREFENFLNEKKNDINFDDLDPENMDTLADVVKNNNEEKDFNDDLKLNDIDEGFDIKSSIEKLRAQLEQEDKK